MSEREQESRVFDISGLEVRQEDDGPPTIVGYAAVFNVRSRNLGGFVEEIMPGAFRATLGSNPDVRASIEHERGMATIGRIRNGTLSLVEDNRGLRVRILPPDTQAGRDAMTLVRGGFIDQMSFMFRTRKDEWKKTEDGTPLRRLHEVDLDNGDVTLTVMPAYPQTSAEARAMAAELGSAEDDDAAEEAEGGQAADETEEERDLQGQLEYRHRLLDIVAVELNLDGGSEQ